MKLLSSLVALLPSLCLTLALPTDPGRGGDGHDVSPPTTGDPPPDPNKVYIESITYAGSGCPANSVAGTFSSDRTVFTLSMDSYIASTGPNVSITESRKNCVLTVRIHYPGGYQYSIFRAQYQGYASIPAGMWGTQTSIYNFAASGQTCQTSSKFPGVWTGNYLVADEIPQETVVWSPCGVSDSILKINSQINLQPVTGGPNQKSALMTTDSIDGSFRHIMGMQWKKCQQ